MPTDKILTATYFTAEEKELVEEKAAAANLSVANWLRVQAGFEPLKRGAPANNSNAVKKEK